jgi:hypothetical protein
MNVPEIFFDPEEAKARGCGPRAIAAARWAKRAREEAFVLMEKVGLAFEDVPRPKIALAVAKGLDDEWNLSPEREAELRALNPEEDWREVEVSDTICFWYFNFSDAEGCRFYLPAFLFAVLGEFPYSDRHGILCLRSHPEKTALLNEVQLSCLLRFYELCEKYPEDHQHES